MSVRLGDIQAVMDRAYPPSLAESWDSVGLVCGDPDADVSRVLFAVDATAAVVDEAVSSGAQLLIAHHPLLLRGVDTVAANTPKGAVVHRLITAGCGLLTAHTNADSADPGVSDALAEALRLRVVGPIAPAAPPALDKWVALVPQTHAEQVRQGLFAAGAGEMGDYRECSWSVAGTGQFRPLPGANPALGAVGDLERVAEDRVEVVAPRSIRAEVGRALRAAHPYEEPAFDVLELAPVPGTRGLGRVGELPEAMTFERFVTRVADALPVTAWGVRGAGTPDREIRTVAVCGGAGDSLLDAVTRLGVDAYVTADLRHHPADEHLRAGGPALVDVAHWASEYPWCAQARGVVEREFGTRVETAVSAVRTDPWTTAGRADRGQ